MHDSSYFQQYFPPRNLTEELEKFAKKWSKLKSARFIIIFMFCIDILICSILYYSFNQTDVLKPAAKILLYVIKGLIPAFILGIIIIITVEKKRYRKITNTLINGQMRKALVISTQLNRGHRRNKVPQLIVYLEIEGETVKYKTFNPFLRNIFQTTLEIDVLISDQPNQFIIPIPLIDMVLNERANKIANRKIREVDM